jgi:hypothetical protein
MICASAKPGSVSSAIKDYVRCPDGRRGQVGEQPTETKPVNEPEDVFYPMIRWRFHWMGTWFPHAYCHAAVKSWTGALELRTNHQTRFVHNFKGSSALSVQAARLDTTQVVVPQ